MLCKPTALVSIVSESGVGRKKYFRENARFPRILYVLNRAFTKSASLPEEMWKLSTVTLEFECCHVTASAHQILCHRVHELFFRMSLKECPRVV